ncbi:hypothetical protein ACTXT7_011946 [Hymenolepis weldensis]
MFIISDFNVEDNILICGVSNTVVLGSLHSALLMNRTSTPRLGYVKPPEKYLFQPILFALVTDDSKEVLGKLEYFKENLHKRNREKSTKPTVYTKTRFRVIKQVSRFEESGNWSYEVKPLCCNCGTFTSS